MSQILELEEQWRALWAEFGSTADWRTPWCDQSWHDGNPIFSAISKEKNRAVRILHTSSDAYDTWRGYGPDGLRVLVICADLQFHRARVTDLLRRWIGDVV